MTEQFCVTMNNKIVETSITPPFFYGSVCTKLGN